MNIREIISQIEDISDDLVIFASKNGDWNLEAPVALVLSSETESIGVDFGGLIYFIETEIAKEVLDVWKKWRNGRQPSEVERIEAIVYYVNNDAYLL